ncbi:hypothetical protein QFZ23_004803 [Arthrobacter globiformis]|uniref:hypothetical protein n=1 Tax=Arthrobacter globiformis TaxID=1665 RepID=UPI002784F835|nr:hypothetical protein [Arthrobacter globiformis]MDQ1060838.1 hypothetical protein [Arthrobacter globiformis]
MKTQPPTFTVTITAHDAQNLQTELHLAEQSARKHATVLRQGILVTQHDYATYSVTVSPEVPYGQTREQRKCDCTDPR